MKKMYIINSGCGGHDSLFRQIIKSAEGKYERAKYPDEADVIIHYACGFTEEQMADIFLHVVFYEQVKKEGAKLIFCGCSLTGYNKEIFKEFKVIDHVIFGMDILPKIAELMEIEPTEKQYYEVGETRLKIKIADGCAYEEKGGACTFCKQNYLKIPMRSKYSIEQICELVRFYNMPIVLLESMNSTNYGLDFEDKKTKLHTLIKEVSKIETVKWIEIDGIASSGLYEELINEIQRNNKVWRIQFFVQSGSDHMLKIMNIGSTIENNERALERFKGKTISGGVVIGHPGETLEDVQKTIRFIEKHNLWYIHVMRYKDSNMIPSGRMKKLSEKEYQRNCRMVEAAIDNLALKNMKNIEENGFIGFVSDIENVNGETRVRVTPLEFDGYYYGVSNIPINIGDKVFIRNPKIWDDKDHSFKEGTLEVLK